MPAPAADLARRSWDAIIVGAGHNGLTCAAYLARAGKRVLVLESRERVGGACTIEEPFPGVRMSPCAYLAGLLHPLVIEELSLVQRGFHWTPAVNGLFLPFLDGTSVQLWEDDERCEREIRKLAPGDVPGWRAMGDVIRRLREALRPAGSRDLWIGDAPSDEEIDFRLGGDDEARKLLLEWSMAEFVGHYLQDERLQYGYLGQGVIGTNASPFDRGTASIRFHHASGRLGGMPGMWGYVRGGMGMISFLLCDRAREAGAVVAAGVPVAAIIPGEGVLLEAGERISAAAVISNADPQATLRLLGKSASPEFRSDAERIPLTGSTVKLNVLLSELPNFTSRPGTDQPHHYGQINAPLTHAEWRAGFAAAQNGELPKHLWCELYFQSVHDPSASPAGQHYDERLCAVCSLRLSSGLLGRPSRARAQAGARLDWALLFESSRGRDRRTGARTAGHRAEDRPDGWTYFPRRLPAQQHVEQATCGTNLHARRLFVRRLHAPGRQRNRDQRPQRGDGGSRRSSQCREEAVRPLFRQHFANIRNRRAGAEVIWTELTAGWPRICSEQTAL